MKPLPLDAAVPPLLEDEVLFIETSGELPEAALSESLLYAGPLGPAGRECLRAAAARRYITIIRRDLDPANLGRPCFRGLERALVNLGRLERFLARVEWGLPARVKQGLAADLEAYLAAEDQALAAGRPYASATARQAGELARRLGLDSEPWAGLLRRMAALPSPDFMGLRALRRLGAARGAVCKRLRRSGGRLRLELLGLGGEVLAGAALNQAPGGARRVEVVWGLLPHPPESG